MSAFLIFILGSPIPYYPRQRAGNEKRDSPKSEQDTGVSVLGAFKLEHLQPGLFDAMLIKNFWKITGVKVVGESGHYKRDFLSSSCYQFCHLGQFLSSQTSQLNRPPLQEDPMQIVLVESLPLSNSHIAQ